ncbi:MAG: MBL fold metallo-hydrolase [Thermodesulfobacteriota bacterium]
MAMKLLILGCGTSTGVPVIGCACPVCNSTDPRNTRTRSSALIEVDGRNILIDTSTDLRAQALATGFTRVDSVLFTHAHADHIHGIDELRSFNMLQKGAISCFGSAETNARLTLLFKYIFSFDRGESITPELSTTIIDGPFSIGPVQIIPVEVRHGSSAVLGFRLKDLAYITDCSQIPPASMEKLQGLDLLVLGALRYRAHPTHMTVEQAIEVVKRLKPGRTILTHLGHDIDYPRDNPGLPDGMEFAFDGMSVEVQEGKARHGAKQGQDGGKAGVGSG